MKKGILLLFTLLCGILSIAADTYPTIDFTNSTTTVRFDDFSTGSYGSGNGYRSPGNINFTASNSNNYTWTDGTDIMPSNKLLQLKKTSGTVTTPSINSNNGCSITITVETNVVTISEIGNTTNTITSTSSNKTITLTSTATSTKFKVSVGSSYAQIKSIEIKPVAGSSTKPAKPTFSPTAGTYYNPQSVTLSTTTSGADIYYTLDGTTPDENSTPYTDAIAINETKTIIAVAYKNNEASDTAMATFTIATAAPSFSPAAGTYTSAQSVSLASETTGASIYYTTDGNDPDNTSTLFDAQSPISVSQTTTIKAIAIKNGVSSTVSEGTYTIIPATPTFSPAAGTFTDAQNVTISCATTGATIYYTTDGNDPDNNSTPYTGAITVSESTTIKAIAYLGDTHSDIATARYYFASTFELVTDESTLQDGDRVIIASGTSGSVKAMGSQNTNNRKAVNETVENNQIIPSDDTQIITLEKTGNNWYLRVSEGQYLYAAGGTSYNYLKTSSKPSQNNGNWIAAITIWKDENSNKNACYIKFQGSANERCVIRYNDNNTLFSCYFEGQNNVYLYKEVSNSKAKEPVIAVENAVMEGEGYIGVQMVTITSPTTGANIYYTTDGTTPTDQSTAYSSAFPVTPGANNAAVTVKAIATEAGKEDPSNVVEFTLNFTNPAAPTITPATKEFTGTTMENVTITTSYANTPIYYTIDGTDPTTSSSTYSDAIDMGSFDAINTTKSVKAMVVVNNVVGAVATATYTRIGVKPAAPAITPGTSNISARTKVTITSDDENTVSLRYQLDSGDPVNVNGQTATVTVPRTGGTLTAWAISADGTASDPATATYTYVAPAAKGTFKLVTSNDQIKAGAKFVIANASKTSLAGNKGSNSYFSAKESGFEFLDQDQTQLAVTGTDIEVITLEESAENGYFYMKQKNGSYVGISSSTGSLTFNSASSTSLSLADGMVSVTAKDGTNQLRYNTTQPRFATYKSTNSSSELVRFYVQYLGPSLAEVKPEVYDEGDEVTIGNDLQVVYLDGTTATAYCRDMEQNSSNFRTPTPSGSYVDYMKNSGMQIGEWSQNNWIELDLSKLADITGVTEGCVIKGGSITGLLSDLNNYQIKVYEDAELEIEQAETEYDKNVYCPANFGEAVQTGVNGQTYFLMQPKPMEVAHITWAVWNGSGFYMAERGQQLESGSTSNMAGLKGGFTVNTSLNGNVTTKKLHEGEAYEFDAIIKRVESSTPAPRRIIDADPSGLNTDFEVYTLTLDPDVVVTGVRDVRGGVQAVDVRYYNAAGVSNAAPWPGVNIIVTTRADGTREVSKRIF